jgi:hypothetical protein
MIEKHPVNLITKQKMTSAGSQATSQDARLRAGAGYWVLDTGCWMLGKGRYKVDGLG